MKNQILSIVAIGFTMIFAATSVVAGSKKDIVDTAVSAGSFNTLAAALTKADLIETLKGDGPFTVFAPTDEAFAKIPKKDLEKLLADKEALTKVLLYHVVPGSVGSEQVVKMNAAKTVEGGTLTIAVKNDGVMVNSSKVVKADVMAANGVIHVIDTVLLP